MDKGALDPQELAALRGAMKAASASVAERPATAEARPIPLIADDRAAEGARPNALRLGKRWATRVEKRLHHLLGVKVDVGVLDAETVEAETIQDALATSWTRMFQPAGRAEGVIAASGAMIEDLAARLLGARDVKKPDDAPAADAPLRAPSPAARRLFGPVGDACAAALVEAWAEMLPGAATITDGVAAAETWGRALRASDLVNVLTLDVKGAAPGQLRLYARPEMLVSERPPIEAIPAPPGAIEEALGAVPVEVEVELGRAKTTLAALAALRVGQVITLDKFIDDPLAVRCGGRVKAFGRALVVRGVMAVTVVDRAKGGSDGHE